MTSDPFQNIDLGEMRGVFLHRPDKPSLYVLRSKVAPCGWFLRIGGEYRTDASGGYMSYPSLDEAKRIARRLASER